MSDLSPRAAYKKWAATYDSTPNLTRDLDALVTRKSFAKRRFNEILDFGCGTGKNTRFFAGAAKRVLALDASAEMIEEARTKISACNVVFGTADIGRKWPVKTSSIDLVSCNLILEHVRDIRPVFHEAARALRPSGRLFVCELHPYRQIEGKKATFTLNGKKISIRAHQHHLSDFFNAAREAGLQLLDLQEWWHRKDTQRPPRLLSMIWVKH